MSNEILIANRLLKPTTLSAILGLRSQSRWQGPRLGAGQWLSAQPRVPRACPTLAVRSVVPGKQTHFRVPDLCRAGAAQGPGCHTGWLMGTALQVPLSLLLTHSGSNIRNRLGFICGLPVSSE